MKIKSFASINGAWALLILIFSSCQETGHEDFNNFEKEQFREISQIEKDEYRSNLIEVSTVLGYALKDKDALNELFTFAELEGNDGDIGYSLKRLFEDKTTPFSKKRSAIHLAVF